jgi:hypothetical protein
MLRHAVGLANVAKRNGAAKLAIVKMLGLTSIISSKGGGKTSTGTTSTVKCINVEM